MPTNKMLFVFINLRTLDLSYNLLVRIEAQHIIKGCPHLQRLWLQHNQIAAIKEIQNLGKMSWLSELDIQGNPCMEEQTNRLRLMRVLMVLSE